MTPDQQFAIGAILIIVAALFIACAIGSVAGWWQGLRDRRGVEPVDLGVDEYVQAHNQAGATTLAQVLIPFGLFIVGLLIVAVYR